MKINPYLQIKFFINKQDGMLKVYIPDLLKNEVSIDIDDYQLIISIQ